MRCIAALLLFLFCTQFHGAAMASELSVRIKDRDVPIRWTSNLTEGSARFVFGSVIFSNWLGLMNDGPFTIIDILLQSVDMFGARVGFVKFSANVELNGKPVPGIVFMRGGSVAVLPIVHHNGKSFVVCVRQARVPIASPDYLEIPAGMLDEHGHFAGAAAKELREEAGLFVESRDLKELGTIYPSPGGSDEAIRLFFWEGTLPAERMAQLAQHVGGVESDEDDTGFKICNSSGFWISSAGFGIWIEDSGFKVSGLRFRV